MNYYVVVEGSCEKYIYSRWIPVVNPSLSAVSRLDDVECNNFYIISGRGYPQYFRVIQGAIEDINAVDNIDRLVISVDSEDMTKEEKLNEVSNFISGFGCKAEICIIIQHFCLEAWALGNRQNVRKNTANQRLISYRKFFDVIRNDPELLPPYHLETLTRAQFAKKYLRTLINDRYTVASYSERNPSVIAQTGYFSQLKKRLQETNHISSFEAFLNVFL